MNEPLVINPKSLSPSAVRAVRLKFNPSGIGNVDRIKLLAAALIDEIESLRRAHVGRDTDYAVTLAITNAQQASMWGVYAATAHLD